MSKTYALKSWDEVKDHHFISKERWNALCERELEAEFLDGFFSSSAMVHPATEKPTIGNTYVVNNTDLREIVPETPTEAKPNPKLYTKDDIRAAAVRVMTDDDICDDNAVASALALAKLIKELN